MTERSCPFTPPDCDLRDFPYMPLMVGRLRRSKAWLMAKRQPEVGFYMINLWTAAWHDFPSGSLENDDDVLADLAMCTPGRWSKVRDTVLHGWVICTDGRLYHSVVAEVVNEAWERRQNYRQRLQKARAAKSQKNDSSIIEQSTEQSQPYSPSSEGEGDREGDREKEKKEGSLRSPKKNRGTRLPDDWDPGPEGRAFAIKHGRDPDETLDRMRDWARAAVGSKAVKADWPAFWRNWCRDKDVPGQQTRLPIQPQAPRQTNTGTWLRGCDRGEPADSNPGPIIEGTAE